METRNLRHIRRRLVNISLVACALALTPISAMGQIGGGGGAPPTPSWNSSSGTDADGSYIIDWNASSGATRYLLQEKVGTGSWQLIANQSATSKSISGKSNGSYHYRVAACNALVECSSYSSSITITVNLLLPPETPTGLFHPAIDFDGTYSVTWNSEVNATYYQLREQRYDSDDWTTIHSAGGTSKSVTHTNGEWEYKVRACNSAGCSGYSTPVGITVVSTGAPIYTEPGISSAGSAGETPFAAYVDNKGNSRIDVPLRLPPGVNGLAPSLSLSFSSGAVPSTDELDLPPSAVGHGWNLAGLPEMTTCSVGAGGLCLNGNLLILVSGSPNHPDYDAVYRTEIETFTKIEMQRSGNLTYYKAYLPNGEVLTFGGTAETNTEGKLALRHRVDAFGNEIHYTWKEVPEYGTNVVARIAYDGADILFRYSNRCPSASQCDMPNDSGVGVPETRAQPLTLNRILTRANGKLVNDYRLDSNFDADGYLRLERLQNCGYNEAGSASSCMAPLEFEWRKLSITDTATSTSSDLLVVEDIYDSYGDRTRFTYNLIDGSGSSNHALHVDRHADFPDKPLPSGLAFSTRQRVLVNQLQRPDGNGGYTQTLHRYQDYPLYRTDGRGFVGFKSIRVEYLDHRIHNGTTGSFTTATRTFRQYRLDFPFLGQLAREIVYVDTAPSTATNWTMASRRVRDYTHTSLPSSRYYPWLLWEQAEERELRSDSSLGYGLMARTINSYCWTPIVSGACSSGTVEDHPTRVTQKVEYGTGIANFGGGIFWGDAISVAFGQTGDFVEQTSEFSNVPANWLLGFAEKQTTTWGETGASQSVTTEFARNSSSDNKVGVIHYFPGDTEYDRTVTLAYDTNGNVTSSNDTGVNQPSALTTFASFADKRYPQTITNAESQATTLAYDPRFGLPDSVDDPNASVPAATTVYDQFGRVTQSTAEDGTVTSVSYSSCTSGCSAVTWATPRLKVTTSYSNNSTQIAPTENRYYDTRGLLLLSETQAFSSGDGWIRTQIHYDEAGRLEKQSLPYHSSGGTPKFVEFHYDHKAREVYIKKPDGSAIDRDIYADAGQGGYLNIEVTETGENRTKRYRYNSLGQLADTTDGFGTADAVATAYTYTVRGDLDTVSVDGVSVANVGYEYDSSSGKPSNRASLWEPNSGTTTFEYYSNSRLEESDNANGNTTRFVYDKLGRIEQRIDGHGTAGAVTNTWDWDHAATNGIGRLRSRSNGSQFTETYSYDTSGRTDTVSTSVNVAGFNDNSNYVIDYGYDSNGRLSTIAYPNLTITKVYTSRGYLSQVKKGSTVLHDYTAMDAFGNVVSESFANGLQTARGFDADTGELTSIQTGTSGLPKSVQDLVFNWQTDGLLYQRIDKRGTSTTSDDLTETFDYEGVGRLQAASTASSGRDLSFTYDDHGNLKSKTSDIAGDLDVTGYTYSTPSQPHRLSSVSVGGVSNTLVYDAVGNITRYNAASGDDTFVDYTNAERVQRITVGASSGTSTPTARDEFWYGPDGQRFLRKASWMESGSLETSWTLYLSGGAFQEVHPDHNPSVDYRQHVMVTENVQHRYVKYPSSSATNYEFMHRDHLGSITAFTQNNANVLLEVDFDPFGRQRESDWASDASASTRGTLEDYEEVYTLRGFTGHEMLNRTGFIHMNGRVFDPRIGRFIQPDPVVGQPTIGDNHNRYAYVLNSPLSATDPTGLDCGSSTDDCGWWQPIYVADGYTWGGWEDASAGGGCIDSPNGICSTVNLETGVETYCNSSGGCAQRSIDGQLLGVFHKYSAFVGGRSAANIGSQVLTGESFGDRATSGTSTQQNNNAAFGATLLGVGMSMMQASDTYISSGSPSRQSFYMSDPRVFSPSSLSLKKLTPAELTFIRESGRSGSAIPVRHLAKSVSPYVSAVGFLLAARQAEDDLRRFGSAADAAFLFAADTAAGAALPVWPIGTFLGGFYIATDPLRQREYTEKQLYFMLYAR